MDFWKTLEKGCIAFMFTFVPLVISGYIGTNPEVSVITVGATATAFLNWMKNREYYDEERGFSKVGKFITFYGIPMVVAKFFDVDPAYASILIGTLLTMISNALKSYYPNFS